MARVQDRNYVRSLIENGKHAREKLGEKLRDEAGDDGGNGREEQLRLAVADKQLPCIIKQLEKRLKKDKPIVEYDLLALKVLLADCADKHAIPAQARAYLADLKDYADEEAHTQTLEEYLSIRHRVEDTEREIYAQQYANGKSRRNDGNTEDGGSPKETGEAKLRAIVQEELLPTLTESEKLWTEGSAIVKILRGGCLAAIPLLLAAGLVPMYMGEICMLGGFHWATLGVAGALVAVLRALGRTARLVAGNEQGVKEVQRAWWGSGLGLVAGLLTYMLVKSNFVPCFLFGGPCGEPDLATTRAVAGCFTSFITQQQIYVHMLLAFLAGYAFERVIDRVRAAAAS